MAQARAGEIEGELLVGFGLDMTTETCECALCPGKVVNTQIRATKLRRPEQGTL